MTDLRTGRVGNLYVTYRGDLTAQEVLELIAKPGDTLKSSWKSDTRRVGKYVVKDTRGKGLVSIIKHTFQRARNRLGWTAALALEERNVPAPRAIAFVEARWFGIILGNVIVSEYLDGFHNMEEEARQMIEAGAGGEAVTGYLERLGDTVAGLETAGVCHNDLAGKNVLTRDGSSFVFIDLDGILLDQPYVEKHRFRNHVQLYDSLLDYFDSEHLLAMLRRLLPDGIDEADWMKRVVEAQRVRRERTLAKWAVEGRTRGE
jgi:tRNA A-37 threonylcarbamoyl transferase component Bud32